MKKMAICLFALALAACMSSAAMAGGDPFSTVRTNSGEEAKWEFEGHVLTPSPSHRTANWLYAPSVRNEGPAMHWYGWTANTLICGAVLGGLATLLPENIARKIPLSLVWIVPLAAVPVLIYALKFFWGW